MVSCVLPLLATQERPNTAAAIFDERVLQHGKDIDVARLDPTLPSESLASWFFSLVGSRADYLHWTVIDCGQPKGREPDTLRCVRGQAKWRQDRAIVVLTIDVSLATTNDQFTQPALFALTVMTVAKRGASDAESDSIFAILEGKRLGEVREILEKAAVRARGKP